MTKTSTVDGIKSFLDKKSRYILQTTKNKMLFAKEHVHTFYEIVHVIVGACMHKINGEVTKMTAGDFIIIRPGDEHAILSADKGTDILCISISNEEYRKHELLYGTSLTAKGEKRPKLVHPSLEARQAVIELLNGKYAYTDNDVRAICSVLFSEYADTVDEEESNAPHSLTEMIEMLALDISLQKQGVSAMTKLAGYSISQLTRLMKHYYHTTPHEHLKELRLSTAWKLVTETSIPLESISYECGYRCYGYFTEVFKKRYGMTPAVYRKSKAQS